MLSEPVQAYARRRWQAALPGFGRLRAGLEAEMETADGDEKTLLQLAYGSLPASDVGSVPFSVLHRYARHALFLRENNPFCQELPEDLFLHFVYYPRINSEDISDCRPLFYRLIAPRLEGLEMDAAVLEVNRWCAEQMTYQASDDRTESPLTAYRCGLGRCGEESTFTVSALRSVGIPARQVYAPYWAHCDDNHAWVEAYANGHWHFLGACEPEPVLDRGWFTAAASRAPLVHYRTFFDYPASPDQLVERRGAALLFNVTRRYAETSELHLMVTDSRNRPAAGANVRIEVVNMAAFRPLLTGRTDDTGCFSAQLGRGSVHIEVSKGALFATADLTLADKGRELQLTLLPRVPLVGTYDLDFLPPAASGKNRTVLSPAQQEENARTLSACAQRRAARRESWNRPEYAAAEPQWREIFHLAGENALELYRFYQTHRGKERELALQMLRSIAPKDYRDATAALLEGHFEAAKCFSGAAHFPEEILNPRIRYETLENWRPALEAAFSPEQRAAYAAEPQRFMDDLDRAFPDGSGPWDPALSMTPLASLSIGRTDGPGRRLLFVAGMRTFGVPARLNPADQSAEYWRSGGYHRVSPRETGRPGVIQLLPQTGLRFVYAGNYTLSRWQEEQYQPLEYAGAPLRISAQPGEYRLVTAQRLPNGKQLCRVTYFTLKEGETAALPLHLRKAAPEEMLSHERLEPFRLRDLEGNAVTSQSLLSGRRLLIYLEVGKEPTEHILNELLDAAPALRKETARGLGLSFVLRSGDDRKNPTLVRVLDAIPEIQVLCGDFTATPAALARRLFLEPGVWPLLILSNAAHQGCYGSAGYQVGVVALALSLSKYIS